MLVEGVAQPAEDRLLRRPHLAVSAALALPLEKGLEVGVKELVRRRRPAEVLDATLHDDAPTEGGSYPSGHAAIAACAAREPSSETSERS